MLLLRAPSPDPTDLASRSHGHFLLPIFPACSMPWVNGLTNLARVSEWLPLLNSCNHPLLALSLPSQTAPPASPSCLEHTLLSLCATFEHSALCLLGIPIAAFLPGQPPPTGSPLHFVQSVINHPCWACPVAGCIMLFRMFIWFPSPSDC